MTQSVAQGEVHGYSESAVAGAAMLLALIAPVLAGAAAYEGFRVSALLRQNPGTVRNSFQIVLERNVVTILGGWILLLIGVLSLEAVLGSHLGLSDFRLILVYFVILLAHGLFGFTLGISVKPAISIPGAVLVSFLWLGFTWSLPVIPIRYLSGLALTTCCDITHAIDDKALVAGFVANATIVAVALLLLTSLIRGRHPSIGKLVSSLLVLTVGMTLALNVVAKSGPYPIVFRSSKQLTCDGRSPSICLFPEQTRGSNLTHLLHVMSRNLERSGVEKPMNISPIPRGPRWRELNPYLTPLQTGNQLAWALAVSHFESDSRSICFPRGRDSNRLIGVEVAEVWLANKELGVQGEYFENASAVVSAYRALSRLQPNKQLQWIRNELIVAKDCDLETVIPGAR